MRIELDEVITSELPDEALESAANIAPLGYRTLACSGNPTFCR